MESTKEKKNLLEFVNVELSLIGEGQYVISVVFILDDITNPDGQEFEQVPGVGDGVGVVACRAAVCV